MTRALALFFRLKAEATKSREVDDALTRDLPTSNVSGYRVPPSNIVVTAVDGEARGVGRTSRSISCGERRERGVSGQAEPFAIENRKQAPEFVPPNLPLCFQSCSRRICDVLPKRHSSRQRRTSNSHDGLIAFDSAEMGTPGRAPPRRRASCYRAAKPVKERSIGSLASDRFDALRCYRSALW